MNNSQLFTRQEAIQDVLYITLGLNLLVLVTKFSLGLVTGSLSLLADALHSLSDSASNILGLLAMRLANPKPDWDHPYGHSKFESLGALGVAAFLVVAGMEILQSAFERIVTPPENSSLVISDFNLILMVAVLAINIVITVYEHQRGKALNSRILIADAKHTLSDVWITMVILLGMIGIRFGLPWLDIVLAFFVAGLIFWSSWEVIRDNVPLLSDKVAIPAREIMATATEVYGVLNCHSITSRGVVGQEIFIEMHMVVAPRDVKAAYEIVKEVECRLQQKYGLVNVTIQLEPYEHIEPLEAHLQEPKQA